MCVHHFLPSFELKWETDSVFQIFFFVNKLAFEETINFAPYAKIIAFEHHFAANGFFNAQILFFPFVEFNGLALDDVLLVPLNQVDNSIFDFLGKEIEIQVD